MFGSAPAPQNENTPFRPRSPYGIAKTYGYWIARNYREGHGIHASNGILFNHESPRRGETFLPRKVCKAAARISLGLQQHVTLGNLEARRDWGYAGDFVEAMWMIVQHPTPDDWVIATGQVHSVQQLLEEAFGCVNLDWHDHVQFHERYLRPTEVDLLCGDYTKARMVLGWRPRTSFKELIAMMVEAELERAGKVESVAT
jgi:GDPmannose 4,6-dehydratase